VNISALLLRFFLNQNVLFTNLFAQYFIYNEFVDKICNKKPMIKLLFNSFENFYRH
jgi:hypothetical protein